MSRSKRLCYEDSGDYVQSSAPETSSLYFVKLYVGVPPGVLKDFGSGFCESYWKLKDTILLYFKGRLQRKYLTLRILYSSRLHLDSATIWEVMGDSPFRKEIRKSIY